MVTHRKNFLPKKVAVFDIDGTIFRSSLLIEIVEEFIDEGIFPQRARQIFEEDHHMWLERKGNYDAYIRKVIQAYETYARGVKLEDAMEVASTVMLFHKNRVYRYTRALVEKLRDTHFMLAISHSPYHIVEPFCREWGFNKVYGFFYETDAQGYFTGKIVDEELMRDKGKILLRAVEKEGLTLKGSVGVGDSETDISFLKMVEKPIAFNPNSVLYKVAKRNHWAVVVERKDVIYKL